MAKIKFTLEKITPKKAAAYLKRNVMNRPISENRVDTIIEDIKSGAFEATHQTIAFDINNDLEDGQHRLTAVVKSGITVWMYVARYQTSVNKDAIDCGVARTHTDRLVVNLLGKGAAPDKNILRFSAIAKHAAVGLRFSYLSAGGGRSRGRGRCKEMLTATATIAERFKEEIDFLSHQAAIRKHMPVVIYAAFLRVLASHPEAAAHIERFSSQSWLSGGDPMKILNRRMEDMRNVGKRKSTNNATALQRRDEVYGAAQRALLLALNGSITQARFAKCTEDYPWPTGFSPWSDGFLKEASEASTSAPLSTHIGSVAS